MKITPLLAVFIATVPLFHIGGVQADSPYPKEAAIASAHPLATQAGVEILKAGGNAFDAAVAVSAALAVVEPAGSGLGGGGFWLLHRAADGFQVMIDGREKAPINASAGMYLNEAGEPDRDLSINGPLSAGIPGLPAALVHIAEKYGKLPLRVSLAPAIEYARKGFAIDAHMRHLLSFRFSVLRKYAASKAVFLDSDGSVPVEGSILKQPDLAITLDSIAELGREAFYHGDIAQQLVKAVQDAGGIWQLDDLQRYEVVEREPIRTKFRNIDIISAAPPSSGGIVLAEALNILEPIALGEGAQRKHWIIEAMRRAYYDRSVYLGDPDFIDIPVAQLLGQKHADEMRSSIKTHSATPSSQLASSKFKARSEGHDTTHFSVLDIEGNRVSATLSVNYPFGSGFVAEGTGVLLNDEMDDFSAHPGDPNVYGLVGGGANAIAPGKRMLSSMTPTFLEDDKGRVAMLGTPGGSRIISMVLLGVLDFSEGHGPHSWVAVPRFHHQYLPDLVQYEPEALSDSERTQLSAMGYHFKLIDRHYGNMQAVQWDQTRNHVSAASDPRRMGTSWVGSISSEELH